jgi:hypothetical protein
VEAFLWNGGNASYVFWGSMQQHVGRVLFCRVFSGLYFGLIFLALSIQAGMMGLTNKLAQDAHAFSSLHLIII